MKVSNISKFFKSTINPKDSQKIDENYRNSLRNQTSSIYINSGNQSPFKYDKSICFNDARSHSQVRGRQLSCNKPSPPNYAGDRNLSKSPVKRGHARRFNGSLFIPGKSTEFINNDPVYYPELNRKPMAESKLMSP